MRPVRRAAILVLVGAAACLSFPVGVRAHGDLASEYLVDHSVFLPVRAKPHRDAVERLATIVREADNAGFRVKVALIAQPTDLGSLIDLYRKPQRYAEFLRLDLGLVYGDGLLVVMPNGFGYAGKEGPDGGLRRTLAGVPAPGRDPTRQVEAATLAVRRLAAAAGHQLGSPQGTGSSESADRITIAAAVLAALALASGISLFRRQRQTRTDSE